MHTIVENLKFVEVSYAFARLESLQCSATFYRRPIAHRNRLDEAETAEGARKTETEMDNSTQRVIAVAVQPVINVHNGSPPKVVDSVFALVLTHRLDDVAEEFPKVLGRFAHFGCVFSQIF